MKYPFDRFQKAYTEVTNSGDAKNRDVRHTNDIVVAPP
jgi:hypothetical protein